MLIEQWLYSFPRRLRCFFHPNQVDEQMKDELQERLEQQIKKNPERGMSAEEARRSAVIALGGVTQISNSNAATPPAEAFSKTSHRTCVMVSGNCIATLVFLCWRFYA